MYKRPSYDIKTTGVFTFKTKNKEYLLKSYHFERENDTEDMLQIQDELRGEIGGIRIKNSAWNKLAKGETIIAKTSKAKGDISGRLTRIDDINNSDKYEKGGDMNEYSKGGNIIERRYVNKDEDYEVRYAKDKPSRMGYKDERMFEGGGSITDRKTELIEKWIKPYSWGKVDENSGVVKTMASKYDLGVVTVAGLFNEHASKSTKKFAVGGEVYSDSKWLTKDQWEKWNKYVKTGKIDDKKENNIFAVARLIGVPVASINAYEIEQRAKKNKFAVGGEIGNQVNFRGDYGKKRSGIVTGKKNNGYIVATDDGNVFVESYEIDSFEEAPVAKKKRFGFFEGGGSVEEYKQAERDYDKYGEYLEDAIEDENEADIKKYKKLMDEAETKMHRYERKYEGGGEVDTVSFNRVKSNFKNNLEIFNGEVVTIGDDKFKIEGNKFYIKRPNEGWTIFRIIKGEMFAGGGEIENKIEKLKKVVSSKMLPESVKAKAQAEIDKLEKELHESKETKAEEKAEHKAEINVGSKIGFLRPNTGKYEYADVISLNGENVNLVVKHPKRSQLDNYFTETKSRILKGVNTESEDWKDGRALIIIKHNNSEEKEEHKGARLDEKEELNATIQKLYGIESKAEDLINYQDGGIQGQSVDKIKKYVEYVNKEVSKLDVPFGSEVFEVLEDENAHSLNLTLGLLGFYKNKRDSGEWAKKYEQYAKVIEVVNEVKGGGKPEAKKPKFKIGDVVGLDLDERTPKMITSFKTNRKGEIIYSGYYIPFPNEKWNYEESEIVLLKTPSKSEAKKPTTRKAPVKAKEKAKKFKVGETVSIIDHPKSDKTNFYKVVGHQDWNDDYGWETTIEKADEKVTMFENLLEKSVAPKADHKKLLAKIKAKKGDKEYDNKASLNPETGERRKRSESSDKKRDALPLGKRVSADGNTYYENRLNRADISKEDKFEGGGEIGKENSGWGLKFLKW